MAARPPEDLGRSRSRRPPVYGVGWYVREKEVAVRNPDGALGELEAAEYLLNVGIADDRFKPFLDAGVRGYGIHLHASYFHHARK